MYLQQITDLYRNDNREDRILAILLIPQLNEISCIKFLFLIGWTNKQLKNIKKSKTFDNWIVETTHLLKYLKYNN